MHWAIMVVIAGVINALVNLGYKLKAAQENVFLIAGAVMLLSGCCMFILHFFIKKEMKFPILMEGTTPLVITSMAVGLTAVMYLFISALSKGPYSIIDPMLACVYALTSVMIGIFFLKEEPGLWSLLGVAVYMVAVGLMVFARSKVSH